MVAETLSATGLPAEATSGLIVAGIVQQRLAELGGRHAQGYLFARPMDAATFGRLLAGAAVRA